MTVDWGGNSKWRVSGVGYISSTEGAEDILGAARLTELAVGFEGARIALQIAFVVKLCRIEEDRHYRGTILFNTTFDQRGVPLMKSSHCRDETDLFTLFANKEKFVLKINNLFEYFHCLFVYRVQN